MSSYSSYQDYLNNKSLPKLIKLIKEKNVTREQLILFLNKEGETVFKKEKTDDIIKRINANYAIDYVKKKLPKLRAKAKAKVEKPFNINMPIKFTPFTIDDTEYAKVMKRAPKALKTSRTFMISVDLVYYVVYYSAYGGKTWRAPNENDTFQFTVHSYSVTDSRVMELVESELTSMNNEYSEYFLVEIKSWSYIDQDKINKAKVYDPKAEPMFGAKLNYDWVDDIKHDKNGKCVFDALSTLERMPVGIKDRTKLLSFFQDCEYRDAYSRNREPREIDYYTGIPSSWIQVLCEKYKISHYCLDIENTFVYKYVPHRDRGTNYDSICYIHHDNHMYLITDKKLKQKLFHSRNHDEVSVFVKMLAREHGDDNKVIPDNMAIYENVPVDKIGEYNDCLIIYSMSNLKDLLFDLYKQDKTLYRHYSVNNKINKIVIEKNNVKLMTDPNHAIKHCTNKETKEMMTWKHVRELCKVHKVPFKNQSIVAFLKDTKLDTLGKVKRVMFTKEQRNQILDSQNGKCNKCDEKITRFHIDHMIPLASNGTNDIDNLQALCLNCHMEKTRNEQENGEYYSLPAWGSTYNKRVHDIISSDLFQRFAFIERLNAPAQKHKNFYIDINKTRRNILLHLKQNGIRIPVFTVMDDVQKFQNGDEIKVGFYYIESSQYFPFRYNGWYSHALIQYGLENNLITKENIKYKLESSLFIEGDYFNDCIKEMINMPYGLDKAGPNFMIGLFNKMSVEVNKMFYTTSFTQASTQYKMNSSSKQFMEKIRIDDMDVYKLTKTEKITSDYFANCIYHLIVDIEAMELHKLKTIIERNNGHVTFLNTDCCECWFNNDQELDLSKYFWDNDKTILKYKYENKDDPPQYERKKQFKHTQIFKVEEHQWSVMKDPEHDNFDEVAQSVLDLSASCNVDGIAGAGKTTLVKKMMAKLEENKQKYIVLAPTNKACRQVSKHCKTIHKFLGNAFSNKDSLKKQLENVDYIFIDEISMVKEVFYSIFLTMKKVKADIKFIISGDWRQLEPVNDRHNFNYMASSALFELCDGNRFELTKCRRSEKDLFEMSQNVKHLNVHILPKVEHEVSICFTNEKRKAVNAEWISKKAPRNSISIEADSNDPNSQNFKVFKGLPVIAKRTDKKLDILNNETFTVKYVDTRKKIVHIIDGEIEHEIKIEDFNKLFHPAYCITTHKCQGSTINQPMTIYEWRRMTDKMKYTAITRATKKDYLNIIY